MKSANLPTVFRRLRQDAKAWRTPVVTKISYQLNPFKVLVSCLLSLRTRDKDTEAASKRLFDLADTPKKILRLAPRQVEKTIYPVAFYRKKTMSLFDICQSIIDHYGGDVPDTLDQLLKLKGVGRKTANLTLTLGHGKLGVCVDTHVHRISNRWGFVQTESPYETEMVLRKKLPKRYWIEYNDLLVSFGQNMCKPKSPYCSQCRIKDFCKQVGVKLYR